jgi:hypothetical protein
MVSVSFPLSFALIDMKKMCHIDEAKQEIFLSICYKKIITFLFFSFCRGETKQKMTGSLKKR